MHIKLFFIRKIKSLFARFKLHFLLKTFEGILLKAVYLSKLSRWINNTPQLKFNDFYNKKVNYESRFGLHEFVIKEEIENQSIDYLEFGVAS